MAYNEDLVIRHLVVSGAELAGEEPCSHCQAERHRAWSEVSESGRYFFATRRGTRKPQVIQGLDPQGYLTPEAAADAWRALWLSQAKEIPLERPDPNATRVRPPKTFRCCLDGCDAFTRSAVKAPGYQLTWYLCDGHRNPSVLEKIMWTVSVLTEDANRCTPDGVPIPIKQNRRDPLFTARLED